MDDTMGKQIEAAPAEKAKPGVKQTTLGELGPVLPLGVLDVDGRTLHKELEVRPWRWKEERAVASMRDTNREANSSSQASLVLSLMVQRFGPHTWPELKDTPEKRLALSQADMGDVLYAWLWLRRESLGKVLDVNLPCPACRKMQAFPVDLDTVEVTTVDDLAAGRWTHKLPKPITIRGKQVTELVLGQTRWNCFEQLAKGPDSSKIDVILRAVHEVPGLGQVVLVDTDLDELTKRDIEAIAGSIDANHVGPDMRVEGECPGCKRSFKVPLEWHYESFFGTSSR